LLWNNAGGSLYIVNLSAFRRTDGRQARSVACVLVVLLDQSAPALPRLHGSVVELLLLAASDVTAAVTNERGPNDRPSARPAGPGDSRTSHSTWPRVFCLLRAVEVGVALDCRRLTLYHIGEEAFAPPAIRTSLTRVTLNNDNNNNNNDDIYSAVIVAEPLREFTRFTR